MIAVIDYGAGNLGSVCNALKKLKQNFRIVRSPRDIARAKKVILPGVGAAGSAMQGLLETGFIDVIPRLEKPFLGICLGMQLLASFSEEDATTCMGIIPGSVKKFPAAALKIPQIGWNTVKFLKKSPLFWKVPDESYFYFVNSFYFDAPRETVIGQSDYGLSFPSAIQSKNFYAVQFHPEKSGEIGLQLLRNFCEKC